MASMTIAPMIQAKMAAGPASAEACQAPNSQPEPIIEPRPVSKSGQSPILRFADFIFKPFYS
ncbi:hypothetical protein PS898_05428 [Pseudomonas fluorescens]|nr:hypothetical protein PS898_05428 [Pseudomonas fluorescens]